jgi:hypothetical protein
MAKRVKKKAEDIEVKAEVVKPSVKTNKHLLKRDFGKLKAGVDSISVGPIGEAFYKSKNII